MINPSIALLQMEVGDSVQENLKTARRMSREAAERGADMLVLPEMFCCPYTSRSFVQNKEERGGEIWSALQQIARENRCYLIGGSMPEAEGDRIYNTSFIFDRSGAQIARHRKVHLFDIDVPGGQRFFESDTFTAGDSLTLIDTEYGRLGVMICFDIRFQEMTRLMALKGARAVIVPAAFNMTTGPAHWELHFRARALDNQIFLCGCAPARDEQGEYVSYGNSIITDPWGDIIARLDETPGILLQTLELDRIDLIRNRLPIMHNRRQDVYHREWSTFDQ